jgi:hypothetical protein
MKLHAVVATALVVPASLLLLATDASACLTTGVSVIAPGPVEPGQSVTYTVAGQIDPAATYDVKINGQVVPHTESGPRSQAGGATGTFVMPKLGVAAGTVEIQALIHHDDVAGETPPQSSFQYRDPALTPPSGTAAPAAGPAPAPGSAPQPATQVTQPGAGATPSAAPPSSPPAMSGPRVPQPQGSPPSSGHAVELATPAPIRARGGRRAARTVRTVGGQVVAPAYVPRNGDLVPLPHRHALRATGARTTPTHTPAAGATLVRPGTAVPVAPVASPQSRGTGSPVAVLVAVALILGVLGVGGAGVAARSRRPPAPEPSRPPETAAFDPVEAELQELIAAELARQLATEPEELVPL